MSAHVRLKIGVTCSRDVLFAARDVFAQQQNEANGNVKPTHTKATCRDRYGTV